MHVHLKTTTPLKTMLIRRKISKNTEDTNVRTFATVQVLSAVGTIIEHRELSIGYKLTPSDDGCNVFVVRQYFRKTVRSDLLVDFEILHRRKGDELTNQYWDIEPLAEYHTHRYKATLAHVDDLVMNTGDAECYEVNSNSCKKRIQNQNKYTHRSYIIYITTDLLLL